MGGRNGAENGIDPAGPTMGRLSAKPPWLDNFTVVYTGQVYTDTGRIAFRENIDDVAWVKVNGEVVINNNNWNIMAQAQLDFGAPGWYDIEIRFSNGGGGAGSITGMDLRLIRMVVRIGSLHPMTLRTLPCSAMVLVRQHLP